MSFRRLSAILASSAALLQGCYEALPLRQDAAPTGVRVQLMLNDNGRAALSQQLGVGIDRVEGVVMSADATSYSLSVFKVLQLNGNSAAWNGERVTVAKDLTVGYQVRQLDKARTTLVVAVVAVGIASLIFGHSLFGNATSTPSPNPPPSGSALILMHSPFSHPVH